VRILDLLGPVLDDPPDLGVADEHALEAHRPGQVRRLVEHVAAADEVLRTGASRIVRESIWEAIANAIRLGKLALISRSRR
jgi:hypothetical protein